MKRSNTKPATSSLGDILVDAFNKKGLKIPNNTPTVKNSEDSKCEYSYNNYKPLEKENIVIPFNRGECKHTECQRLCLDNGLVGFNYEYMGAAEYEFGANKNTRTILLDENTTRLYPRKLMHIQTLFGTVKGPFEIVYDASVDKPGESKNIDAFVSLLEENKVRNKGVMLTDETVAWLVNYPVRAMIYRSCDKDRKDAFLSNMHNQILNSGDALKDAILKARRNR